MPETLCAFSIKLYVTSALVGLLLFC